jgi:hypothetical protein
MFFSIAPFILFGENSIITVHDNLDHIVSQRKMFHDMSLFWVFDAPTKGANEMSTLFYSGYMDFSIPTLIYSALPTFVAYTINNTITVVLGFLSMFLLLAKSLKISKNISLLTACCYSVLPLPSQWNVALAILPLAFFAFIYFLNKQGFSWKIILLFIFPAFSSIGGSIFFVDGVWFIGMVVCFLKNRKININLLVGFILLILGTVLVNLRLFYVMLVLKIPMNRSIFANSELFEHGFLSQLKLLLKYLCDWWINGQYHGTTMQRALLYPLSIITLIILLGKKLYLKDKLNKTALLFLICQTTIIIFSCFGGLYDSQLLGPFFQNYIRPLAGFNWGRIAFLNRVLWYVSFALILSFASNFLGEVKITISKKEYYLAVPSKLLSCSVIVILFIYQCWFILIDKSSWKPYNDARSTWAHEYHKIRNIDDSVANYISWKEFYDEKLFDAIKQDIAYNNEKVVAYGYHPSVLMYNNFNCIDDYNGVYPLSYMQKFRMLIVPVLKKNEAVRKYYDAWGGRKYIFLGGVDSYFGDFSSPTRSKETEPVPLDIDMDVFKKDFNGKYIISRVEISNADEIGLKLLGTYTHDDSIYVMSVYEAR